MYLGIIILCISPLSVLSESADFHSDKVLDVITFGSCNKHNLPQPLWENVLQQNPDLWIWLGDAVYADTKVLPFVWIQSAIETMKERFDLQKEVKGYKNLLESGTPVIGVWDDHDYGINNGGKSFGYRHRSQDLYLDFLNEPLDSIRRRRKGLYASYTYGSGNQKVKVILLDVRSHFENSFQSCDILGEEQWKWLEGQLDDNTTAFTLVGTGIQVLSDNPFIEKWMQCSSSMDRLIWLVQKFPKVILLSGDVHFSEINCRNATSTGYPLYEATSSGMTHSCSTSMLPSDICDWTLKNVVASKYRVSNVVTTRNFGAVKIDWNSNPVTLEFEIIGTEGKLSALTVSLDDLLVRREPAACPVPIEQPNWYWKRVFWCSVIILVITIALITLRTVVLALRWVSMVLLKDLDTKIKHRLMKIKQKLPNVEKNGDRKIHTD